jgi:dCTP deaminase
MILSDREIIELFNTEESPGLIVPFYETLIRDGKVSYGLGSYGYDIRLSDKEFLISDFELSNTVIDPKNIDKSVFRKVYPVVSDRGTYFVLPAYTYGLGTALEFIKMPDDVTGICIDGKSTYARSGVVVNMTPIEAGWRGHLTIAVSNVSPFPCRVYANEGIAQLLFFKGSQCKKTYEGRKYQDQAQEVVLARI